MVRWEDDPEAGDLVQVPADAAEERLAIAVARGGPLIATGCRSAEDVGRLAARLAVVEATLARGDGTTRLAALVDHPAGVLDVARIAMASDRLFALGLDEATLAGHLGLSRNDEGAAALRMARGATVLAAAAHGLLPVLRPQGALSPSLSAEAARADGFAVAFLAAPKATVAA